MGYIVKRSGRWQAAFRDPSGRERTRTFDVKRDAQAWLDTNGADLARGGWIDPDRGKVTFGEYADDWISTRPDLRPRTVALYRSLLKRHLLPAFGATPIAKLTSSSVSHWHAILVASTPGAAASAYRLLRAIFATAVRDELLLRSPCRVARGAADRAVERPMLTVAEVDAVTDTMPAQLRAAVVLASWGGLRRGEVLGLQRRHVDPLRQRVRVERQQIELNDGSLVFSAPKSDAGIRTVHLPDGAMAAVVDHLAAHVGPEPDALLFTGRGGVPLRPRTLASAFRAARASCDLPQVRFHDLRHFGLTMAAAAGATTKELMARAGHASPAAALRYQHATEDRDRALADALSGLQQKARVVDLPRTSRGQETDAG